MNRDRIARLISFDDDEDTSTGFNRVGGNFKPEFREWFQHQPNCCIEEWDDESERWYFWHPDQDRWIIELAYCIPYDLPDENYFNSFKAELKGLSQYGPVEFFRTQNITNRFDQNYIKDRFRELEDTGNELIKKYESL